MDLKGKVVLITGGTGGIGRALTKAFLTEGAKVCLADLFEDVGDTVVKELGNTFGSSNIIFSKCDVTKDESFEEAFVNCESKFGPVNILINNAGIVNERNWQKSVDVNLSGTIRGCELALKKMGKHNGGAGGHVINVGSASGLSPNIASVYTSTKGGVVMYTRSIGMPIHFSYTGICFQCICPTLVDTTFFSELQNIALHENVEKLLKTMDNAPRLKPENIAEAVLKLLGDGKTGAVMVVSYGEDSCYIDAPNLNTVK